MCCGVKGLQPAIKEDRLQRIQQRNECGEFKRVHEAAFGAVVVITQNNPGRCKDAHREDKGERQKEGRSKRGKGGSCFVPRERLGGGPVGFSFSLPISSNIRILCMTRVRVRVKE